jgi:hypothetical protein
MVSGLGSELGLIIRDGTYHCSTSVNAEELPLEPRIVPLNQARPRYLPKTRRQTLKSLDWLHISVKATIA